AVGKRVGVDAAGVFAGGVVVPRLVGAGGDLGKVLVFLGDRLVAALDRPVVVRADRGGVIGPLPGALGGDVGGIVIHHAGDGGAVGRGDLIERLPGARLEVVPQSQRVPDLVHHHFLERLMHEFFGNF